MMVTVGVNKPDRKRAAAVLRDLARRVQAGELEGKRSVPFLLGLAAGLEAEEATGADETDSAAPPAST